MNNHRKANCQQCRVCGYEKEHHYPKDWAEIDLCKHCAEKMNSSIQMQELIRADDGQIEIMQDGKIIGKTSVRQLYDSLIDGTY